MTARESNAGMPPRPPVGSECWAFGLQGAGIGLWDWDVSTNRVIFSQEWKTLFGYADEEVSHELDEWVMRIHPQDLVFTHTTLQDYAQGNVQTFVLEHRLRCKDGSYRWVMARANVHSRNQDGKPLRIVGTHTDITEHKHLARRLTIQHQVAEILVGAPGLDNAIAAILKPVCHTLGWDEGLLWVVDESIQRLRFHSMWTASGADDEHYGMASRELTFDYGVGLPGRVWAGAKPVWISDVTRDRNFPRAALAEQVGFHTAAAFPVRVGDRVYAVLEFFHHEILPEDPALLSTFQAVADQLSQFCARKRAEGDIAVAAAELRGVTVAINAVQGVAEFGLDGTILAANDNFLNVMGYQLEEVLWKHHRMFCEPGYATSPEYQAFWAKLNRGEFDAGVYRRIGKGGKTVWIQSSYNPILDSNGKPYKIIKFATDITQQKLSEGMIAESRAQLQTVLDAATEVSIIALNPQGIVTLFNAGAERMLGYRAEEMVGKPIEAIIRPEDDVAVDGRTPAEHQGQPLAGCYVFTDQARQIGAEEREWAYVRKDGSRVSVSVVVTTVRNGQGNVTGFLSIAKDISIQKRAEAVLREQQFVLQERLKEARCLYAVSKLIGDDHLTIDQLAQHIVALFPPAFQHPETVCARIQLDGKEFTTPAFLETERKYSAAVSVRGNPIGVIEICSRRDLSTMGESPFLAEEEQMIEAIAQQLGDVVTRKQAEAAIEHVMRRYKDLIDSITGVVWEADVPTMQFTFISPQIVAILGYPVDQWLSSPAFWVEHIHPEDRTWAPQYGYEETRLQRAHAFEYRMLAADGRTVWIRDSVSVLVENGQATKLRGIMEDVTSRKLSEVKLAQAAKDLEQKNQELAVARDKALEAVKVKAEFLATMSHEIRTPMNGVIGMTGLLLDTPLNPQQREYAETVRLSGEHLLDIINEILDFSKIEAGKLKLETLTFDLHATVEDAVSLLGERADAKGLELMSLVQAGVPTALRGDPGRLRQVLVNLIGNAIKFTERGEVVVAVNVLDNPGGEVVDTTQPEPYRTLQFEVSDTGVGIREEQLAKLFQPFTQADGSNTRKYGGTGLGLAICKQLIGMMGGRIGVHSKVGEGSTFWFTLNFPLQPEDDQPVLLPHMALRDRRVLIVDDHLTNRKILEQSLGKQGVICESASDGFQALECLRGAAGRKNPFDLAILDMQMPGMDGLELAHHIKSDALIAATRLILLTSVGQRGDAKRAQDVGIAAYLTKPIRQSLLYECLSVVLGSISEPGVAAAPTATSIITRHSLSEAQTRSKPMILVVDDNPVNQKVAANMIEKLGYRVNVAANGREAVESLSRILYALIFMDCQMPEMDGFEATRVIRTQEASLQQVGGKSPHLPIVAMTANAMQEDREHCLAAGMDDFISKPVTKKTLEVVLNRWVPHDQDIPGESKAA